MNHAITGDSVVAGVDGPPGSTRAVEWAAREASRMHRPLILVHQVYAKPLLGAPFARRAAPRVRVTVESSLDGPIPLLVNKSGTARVVALGLADRSALRDLLAVHGRSPVTVVHRREPAGPAGRGGHCGANSTWPRRSGSCPTRSAPRRATTPGVRCWTVPRPRGGSSTPRSRCGR
ncbi:universal stress protein [Amycolatopsis thermophila]|uniref:Nucleotide-binding universal stress UspA family protein n=1 Tax=Amycolatopsis thermophila TaxID=206084 RepID=A0ABU0F2Q6_9PSEU|nr:universal stress protein [Amycolatopsis thermophila]MDQ0381624.1 nucleotide-binding universal stress UspA family protein [Amycolatopsis thermophila]